MSSTEFLILGGIAACLVLSGVIFLQLRTLAYKKKHQAQQHAQLNEYGQKKRQDLIKSVQIIAGAMLNDEHLTASEAVIRLNGLLNKLAPKLKQQSEVLIISEFYQQISHIPYLEEWKQLSKQEKWQHQQQMAQLEQQHKSELEKAAKFLQSYPFSA